MDLTTNAVARLSGFWHISKDGLQPLLTMPVGRQAAKTLLIMKLTAIILISACLTASATGHSQGITLSKKDAELQTVLKDIEKQSGYQFFYNERLLQGAKKVSIDLKNASLQEALDVSFKDQPFTYAIVNKTIVIKQKQREVLLPGDIRGNASFIDISGRVTDINGSPLEGATVAVRGTKNITKTNSDGVFVLKRVEDNATLVISYTEFTDVLVQVNNQTSIIVSLKRAETSLQEVIVNKGYYTEKQKYSVGNVSRISGKDIEKQPVGNLLQAIQGRAPGLFLSLSNGISGSGSSVRIQGVNSIQRGNEPLYIVDGVPFPSQLLSTTLGFGPSPLGNSGGGFGSAPGSSISYLSMSDIESVEILKDADATAIYGSRAANGVILITTKKGKQKQERFNISFRSGWGKTTRLIELMNTTQYLAMRREAKKNDNASISSTDYDINGFWDTTRYTDWQKELLGKTARQTTISANISGGNEKTQYFIGSTYFKETTVFPGDYSDQKASVHFNLNNVSLNQKFKIQFSGTYLSDNNQLPQEDLTNRALSLAPDAPKLYNADGSLNWMPNATGTSTWTNPLARLNNTYENKGNSLVGNIILGYTLFEGLELKNSLGYSSIQTTEFAGSPLSAITPESRATGTRRAYYSDNSISSWILEPQIDYNKKIWKGSLNVMVGTTFQQVANKGKQLFGSGYPNDALIEDIRAAASVSVESSIVSEYKYAAAFGRFNYNVLNKYLFNLTGRRDGSSRFGGANQFHNFGAVGVGWIFSEESFFQRNLRLISFGKVKASFGTTGSDQIGDYQFMDLYSALNSPVAYQNYPALQIRGLPNPYLQWEETRKMQFGIDLGLIKDRIFLATSFVRNRSSNQLLGYSLPLYVGFGSITTNFPATVQNTSWEFSLTSVNIRGKKLSWTSSVNFTVPKNKLVSFVDLANSAYSSGLIIGQPIDILRVFYFAGVNPSTGGYQFYNANGNATSNPGYGIDQFKTISRFPKFYGGLQNSINYNGFELDVFFQFVKQVGANYSFGRSIPGARNANQPIFVLDRWQKLGDNSSIQKYNSNSSLSNEYLFAIQSDAGYSDASYLRLKNLALSWQLPTIQRRMIGVQDLRVYLQAQNLLTFTKYKGADPETQSNSSIPPLRMITTGIQLTL